ncbi:MAG: hypothetical protein ACI9OU_002364 [Candidatus Promineifilaceae bacterium]|jgi:hypothetical protein
MDLTDDQKKAVAEWVSEGEGLSDIQKRIKDEFEITMTYMDVRFLVLDLGVDIKDKEEPKPPNAEPEEEPLPPPPESGVEDVADATGAAEEGVPEAGVPAPEDGLLGSNVSLDVDRVVKPGALASGSVTFSDGQAAQWSLDQFGRLALDAGSPDYKPSEQDIEAFQLELRGALETRGF